MLTSSSSSTFSSSSAALRSSRSSSALLLGALRVIRSLFSSAAPARRVPGRPLRGWALLLRLPNPTELAWDPTDLVGRAFRAQDVLRVAAGVRRASGSSKSLSSLNVT